MKQKSDEVKNHRGRRQRRSSRRKIASRLGKNGKEGVTAAVTGKTYEYEPRYKLPPLLPPTNDSKHEKSRTQEKKRRLIRKYQYTKTLTFTESCFFSTLHIP